MKTENGKCYLGCGGFLNWYLYLAYIMTLLNLATWIVALVEENYVNIIFDFFKPIIFALCGWKTHILLQHLKRKEIARPQDVESEALGPPESEGKDSLN